MTIRDRVRAAATTHLLDPRLVLALVTVESGENPFAWNPEPAYRYFWDVKRQAPFRQVTHAELAAKAAPADFPTLAGDRDQEWWGQAASWGLTQIMGALARERGFRGRYLTELVDPAVNLEIGCSHLAALLGWAGGVEMKALSAYNGGKGGNSAPPYRNASYAQKVLQAKQGLTDF